MVVERYNKSSAIYVWELVRCCGDLPASSACLKSGTLTDWYEEGADFPILLYGALLFVSDPYHMITTGDSEVMVAGELNANLILNDIDLAILVPSVSSDAYGSRFMNYPGINFSFRVGDAFGSILIRKLSAKPLLVNGDISV
ncbi:hypothetical protein FISHEDRAFT_59909 [Fistulina hepatica ATCC 64428]|uniref:Uncharacterized protein n=1 Tax=Fistulina hepatica ATCC 64428 TaxID=1128425 RepID=A0A0D7A9E1_9AGAR|nr:hypothetical protein FISHEDRAFT_59909 [Fistulina hepatica ATCC 64428]